MPQTQSGPASAALWKSPFRPFYLLGSLYCPLLMLLWLGSYSGILTGIEPGYSLALWHGHEMIFGFFGAIVAGFTLTFIGSWAQTEELSGWPLMLLALLWLTGRLAFYFSTALPPLLVLVLDASLYLAISIMVLPGLWASPRKIYLGMLIIFGGICLGNVLFHWGAMHGDMEFAALGLRVGAYAIMIKLAVVGAFLIRVFTNNILPQQGVAEIRPNPVVELLSILSLALFILSDLFSLDTPWRLSASLFALLVHSVRFAGWQSWQVRKYPIILIMHLAYGWLLIAFGLRALHDFNGDSSNQLWLHAFTVGSLGLMGISFMTRVVLRHTGRQLTAGKVISLCYAMIFIAALLRLYAYLFGFNAALMIISALLWTTPFAVYLVLYGRMLWQPSLPKGGGANRD